jgi:hypothetical protein
MINIVMRICEWKARNVHAWLNKKLITMNRVIGNIVIENTIFEIDDEFIKKCYRDKKSYPYLKKWRLLHYLKNVPMIIPLCDCTTCIFSNKIIDHPQSWFTDGEWIWSADLTHYTKKYNFQWPEEFIKTLENKKYKLPKKGDIDQDKILSNQLFIKYGKNYLGIDFTDPK